jgi:hypothetical protein
MKIGALGWVVIVIGGILVIQNSKRVGAFLKGLGGGAIKGGGAAAQQGAFLGQGGTSSLTPLYFSGAALTGSHAHTLAPGGAGRSTLPGVINTTSFKGRYLNKYGR